MSGMSADRSDEVEDLRPEARGETSQDFQFDRQCIICKQKIDNNAEEILYGSYEVCEQCNDEVAEKLQKLDESLIFCCIGDTNSTWDHLDICFDYCSSQSSPVMVIEMMGTGNVWLKPDQVTKLRDLCNKFLEENSGGKL